MTTTSIRANELPIDVSVSVHGDEITITRAWDVETGTEISVDSADIVALYYDDVFLGKVRDAIAERIDSERSNAEEWKEMAFERR